MKTWRARLTPFVRYVNILIPVMAVVVSLLISAIPIALTGHSPLLAYREILLGAFGNPIRIAVTLTKATPILLSGLAVAIGFRSGVFNVGAEGQLYMGALGATLVALGFPGLPAVFLLPFSLAAAFVFGAIWGLIPGYLKAARNTNEVIVTIMMNFVAFWIVSYLVHGPMRDPTAMFSYSEKVPEAAMLPVLVTGTQLHAGYLMALVIGISVHVLINYTSLGFQMRAVGGNPEAAQYAGMKTKRIMLLVFGLGGGIAGLAGATEILGVQFRLSDFFSAGYGWDGIGVTLVGGNTVFGIFLASHFFGILRSGSSVMERRLGVSGAISLMIQGLAVFFTVVGVAIRVAQSPRLIEKPPSSDPEPASTEPANEPGQHISGLK